MEEQSGTGEDSIPGQVVERFHLCMSSDRAWAEVLQSSRGILQQAMRYYFGDQTIATVQDAYRTYISNGRFVQKAPNNFLRLRILMTFLSPSGLRNLRSLSRMAGGMENGGVGASTVPRPAWNVGPTVGHNHVDNRRRRVRRGLQRGFACVFLGRFSSSRYDARQGPEK